MLAFPRQYILDPVCRGPDPDHGKSSSRGQYVLGELHINVFLGLGVHEQDAVVARLLDHANVEIVPPSPLVLRLRVLVDGAGDKVLGAVAVVARSKVDGPAGGDGQDRKPEAFLNTNSVSGLLPDCVQRCAASLRASCGGQWVLDVRPWAPTRMRDRGRGSAHRERSDVAGGGAWYGPSGQQRLLSCEVTASCEGWLSWGTYPASR